MNKKLHIFKCILDENNNLIDIMRNAELFSKENNISCPILYIEDIICKIWVLYFYKDNKWIRLDKGELSLSNE